ncbi:hypothetical protein C5B85_07055 [Pseudoclavibacter sp. AY1F1]|nr:hypothetical protein C5B85_07055 [Pseudoclavibacter sp. AY1F1]
MASSSGFFEFDCQFTTVTQDVASVVEVRGFERRVPVVYLNELRLELDLAGGQVVVHERAKCSDGACYARPLGIGAHLSSVRFHQTYDAYK